MNRLDRREVMGLAFSAAIALSVPAAAQDGGDAEAGADLAKKRCAVCHVFEEGGGHKIGPNLFGVIGRQAGNAKGFTKYGDSLAEAGEQGLVWDGELVAEYIADPKAFLRDYLDDPGATARMTFKLRKAGERADVVAFLKTLE